MPRSSLKFLIVPALFLIAGLVFLCGVLNQALRYANLQSHGLRLAASVDGVFDGKGGRSVRYSYQVSGTPYKGRSPTSLPYDYRGKVTIYYSASDPGFSSADPGAVERNSLFGVLFMIVWNGLVVWIGYRAMKGSRLLFRPR